MSIVFPIVFFLLFLGGLIAFHFWKKNKIVKLVFLGLSIGFGIASFIFGMLFAHDVFNQDNLVNVTWAVISLYIVLFSIVFFVYTFKMHKAFGICFLAAILIFGVVFLVIGFNFGRTSLDNEEIISVSSKLILLLPIH